MNEYIKETAFWCIYVLTYVRTYMGGYLLNKKKLQNENGHEVRSCLFCSSFVRTSFPSRIPALQVPLLLRCRSCSCSSRSSSPSFPFLAIPAVLCSARLQRHSDRQDRTGCWRPVSLVWTTTPPPPRRCQDEIVAVGDVGRRRRPPRCTGKSRHAGAAGCLEKRNVF